MKARVRSLAFVLGSQAPSVSEKLAQGSSCVKRNGAREGQVKAMATVRLEQAVTLAVSSRALP